MVHTASSAIEVFRKSRIDVAHFEVCRLSVQCMQGLTTFLCKSTFVKRIGIHHCHMGKDCSVFFISVGKSKHSSKICLDFPEICVQTVATHFFIIEITVCTLRDLPDLLFCCSASHDGKYLAG